MSMKMEIRNVLCLIMFVLMIWLLMFCVRGCEPGAETLPMAPNEVRAILDQPGVYDVYYAGGVLRYINRDDGVLRISVIPGRVDKVVRVGD